MINLRKVILHKAFVQEYIVYRSSGSFINGRWTENTPVQIPMSGVVSVVNEKELNALPEGDRIKGAMRFHSTEEILLTRSGEVKGTSDSILWNGQFWRIFNVSDYSDYGYYRAYGERIKGN
jgi:hypothetical protein